MKDKKAFLKQVIALEKQSLAAHERELELLETDIRPKRKNTKNERIEKYTNAIRAGR